jgi:hypothetical protein
LPTVGKQERWVEKSSELYRRRAAEFTAQAETARTSEHREALLRLARAYERLAEAAAQGESDDERG